MSILSVLYDNIDHEFHRFDRVLVKLADTPNQHALYLLNALFEDSEYSVEQDDTMCTIWFNLIDDMSSCLNEGIIIELLRCGVIVDPVREKMYLFSTPKTGMIKLQ